MANCILPHYFVGPWSNWNQCSVSCGNGTKYRTRTCITDCENGTIQYKECYKGCCSGNETMYPAVCMCMCIGCYILTCIKLYMHVACLLLSYSLYSYPSSFLRIIMFIDSLIKISSHCYKGSS